MNLKQDVRLQFILGLLAFFVLTAQHLSSATALYLLLTCVGFSLFLDFVITRIVLKKAIPLQSAVITGFIITLVIDPSAAWYQVFLICLIAIGAKVFLRPSVKHIFNPAAAGLFAGWMLFGLYPSWWGPTLFSGQLLSVGNILLYVLLGLLVWISGYRYKRFYAGAAFLLSYAVLYETVVKVVPFWSLFSLITNPGILFFTIVMLVEPKTSPAFVKKQLLYGITVAIISIGIAYISLPFGLNLPDAFIFALLLGNLLFF